MFTLVSVAARRGQGPEVSGGTAPISLKELSREHEIAIVLSRCGEGGRETYADLRKTGVNLVVYQKAPCCMRGTINICNGTWWDTISPHVRFVQHNLGDECSAYLQYIVEEYNRLPAVVYFAHYGVRIQLIRPTIALSVRFPQNCNTRSIAVLRYQETRRHQLKINFLFRWRHLSITRSITVLPGVILPITQGIVAYHTMVDALLVAASANIPSRASGQHHVRQTRSRRCSPTAGHALPA